MTRSAKIISIGVAFLICFVLFSPTPPSLLAESGEEVAAGAGPAVIPPPKEGSSSSEALSVSEATVEEYTYVSHVFTVADVIFFSYKDGTMVALFDSSGTLIWNNNGNPLNKGEHTHIAVSQGVYTACGSEKFAVLTGDPITRYVVGYYAMDQNGYGASMEFYTWVPYIYEHCSFIIFAYQDNTQVTVEYTDTGIDIAVFILNKGEHWRIETLDGEWLHVTANNPVSVLTAYDQGYFVPSASGKWSGTEFYTYVSDIASWPEDLTVIAYNDGTSVTIKDSDTGTVIWSGTLNSGQAHVETHPNGADKFFTITSSKTVTVSVQPWISMTSSYHQGAYVADGTGAVLGTDLIGSTLDGGYLYILAYSDNTNVVVYNSQTGDLINSYTLDEGDYVEANPGNGLWRIMSNYPVSAYSGWGHANADFAPVEFREVTAVNVDISTDKNCYASGEGVTVSAKVTDANGNPLYPLQRDNFKVSVDGSEVHLYDGRIEKAIGWAENKLGSPAYPYKCLRFVWDAYESTDAAIPLLPYECAKDAADALGAEDNPGDPPRGAYVFYDCSGTIEGEYRNWGHVGLSLGDGQVIHAFGKVRKDDYLAIQDLSPGEGWTHPKYIGWAWPPITPPITVFERVSCTDYKLKIEAPNTSGTYLIKVTATAATGTGSDSTEINVYTIDNVYLTIEGNRLTDYENSANTPIYYRGDSNIYPVFFIDVEVNGATLSEIKDSIQVFANITDYTKVKDSVSEPASYDSGIKYKADWENSPDDYPVGRYNATAKVRDSDGNLLGSSTEKHFYLIFKPPSGYEDYISTDATEYNQLDYQLWKPVLDEINQTNVEDAAKKLLLFAHGIDGSYYGYWHTCLDETQSFDEQKGFHDPTHNHAGYVAGNVPYSIDYAACSGIICPALLCSLVTVYGGKNAWWHNMIDFVDSDFDPEGKATHKRPVGVCDDYATLFVSHARSAGIPATERTGFFHEWAEIFNGSEWVHCDPTWYQERQIDSPDIRVLYDTPDVYTNDRGFPCHLLGIPFTSPWYLYKVEVTVEFDSDDYNYGDWVNADIIVNNTGYFDIKRELYLLIIDKPPLLAPPSTAQPLFVNIGTLDKGESTWITISYLLPDCQPNWYCENLGDRFLIVQAYYKGNKLIPPCFPKWEAYLRFHSLNEKVPGLCPEWNPQITVDGSTAELSTANSTSFYFDEATNESTEIFVRPQNASVTVEHKIKYSTNYTRENWYILNPENSTHDYSLMTPLLGTGDAVYIPGYGSITANQSMDTSADYIVIYNTTVGTSGSVNIYAFSKNVTLKEVTLFSGVVEAIGVQNCTLVSESGESYLSYLSTRDGSGMSFDEIYNNFAQEIVSNQDTLTQFFIEGEHEQISYYKVGDTVYVNTTISNNGMLAETRNLSLTISELGVWVSEYEYAIYNTTETVMVPAKSGANVTFQYQIPDNPQIGKHRIIISDNTTKATTIFMIQAPFNVTFDVPATVAQAEEFYANASITNALNTSLSGINVTIELPNDFNTSESLTKNIGTLTSGESADVSWLVNATDFEYGYAPIALYMNSTEGINDIATTFLTVLKLPELKIFPSAPPEAQISVPFDFEANVTNDGDLNLSGVSVNLSLPANVTATGNLTKLIGDLAGGQTESVNWSVTSMVEDDFWVDVNGCDTNGTYCACATELVNMVKPEIELDLVNPVEVMLNQSFSVIAKIKNTGELNATQAKVNLSLPSEFVTLNDTFVNIGNLSKGQTKELEWTLKGVDPGYGDIRVNVTLSGSVSITRGIIVTCFPLWVETDKETYATGDNVIITTKLSNNNPEISYIDLHVNITVEDPGVEDRYSMPIDYISSLESRNFALSWNSSGKPSGSYVVNAKILEDSTLLNETSTSFTLGGATLEGHVNFSGRGSPPCGTWIEPFVVRGFEPGNLTNELWTENATTNATGVFTITGLDPSTYDIGIKNWTCLSEMETGVALITGATVVDFDATREGDSNNDDWIVLADRTILYTGWGSQEGDAGWNAHCDFNRDGWLTLADRTLMYTYWGQHGGLV